jgi:hypothetical protein
MDFTPPAVREFLKIQLMIMTIYEYMPLKQKTQTNQRFNQYMSFVVFYDHAGAWDVVSMSSTGKQSYWMIQQFKR